METDYLVVGAGAMAMAFVDTLLDETDRRVVMVDRHDRAGGHWNDAYGFVRLHMPSAWYGVASRLLPGSDDEAADDDRGASGATVLDYFDRLMRERFVASGRVRWLPMSDYRRATDGSHRVCSLLTGEERTVTVRHRLVDATLTRTEVPATHPPSYAVAPGVSCIAPNSLPAIGRPHARYTVVGGGKTGMDACLWLLDHEVPASRIRWIVPRDAWLLDRVNMCPGAAHFARSMGSVAAQYAAMAEATSVPDLFARLEACGVLLRLDPSVEPTRFRGAVASRNELARLRAIEDVVRLGRVASIEPTRLVLERGQVAADVDTLYVDCSASAIHTPGTGLVFDGEIVRLVMLSWGQPLFSAALTAHVEVTVADEAERNALCRPVPFPDRLADWPAAWAASLANAARWRQHPEVHAWARRCRLHGLSVLSRGVAPDDPDARALVRAAGMNAAAAAARLGALHAARPEPSLD
jgi:hypothetical protein